MKLLANIFIFFLCLTSCKIQTENANNIDVNSQTYHRIRGDNSWGFLNQDNDTIIPLNRYQFLNPIDEEGMILAHSKGKSGYINISQDTLIPFKYEDISVFSNGLAPAKLNGKYGYIDRSGKVVIQFEYENESHFYTCGLAKAQLGGKYGFIDKSGNEIVPIQYERVRYNKVDDLICVSNQKKWAFFSCKGEQLTDFEFDAITEGQYWESQHTYFKNGLCLVQKEGKFGFINTHFQTIVPFGEYQELQPFGVSQRAIVKSGNFYGLIDTTGQFVLEPKFNSIEYFPYPSGRYRTGLQNRLGIVDSKASRILPNEYFDIQPNYFQIDTVRKGILILKSIDGKSSVTNYDGDILIPAEYENIEKFEVENGFSYSVVKKNGKYGLINHLNRAILPIDNDNIFKRRFLDYLIVEKNNFQGLYSKSGVEIVPKNFELIDPCYYDEDNRFIVKQNGLYGVINVDQKIIIPIEFNSISNWVEYGPEAHFVVKGGKHGLIDREGKIIIPPVYQEIEVDNSTLIKVKNKNLFGTVNWKNEIIHPIKYDQILWEWPYLTQKELDTIFLSQNGRYFSTDISGNIYEEVVDKKIVDEKFGYLSEIK